MTLYWIILLAIAVAVVFISVKIGQPYPTLLVIAGLVLGILPIPGLSSVKGYIATDTVFQTTVISIFLAALLGDASIKFSFPDLIKNKKPILLLSFAATLLTFLIVAILTYFVLHLPLQQALIFGAVMSATDPVSVLSIFKSMGINKDLSLIVEGESVANDGVAAVLFRIAIATAALSVGGALNGVFEFVKVVVGSVLIGGLSGFVVSRIASKIDDYLVEIGLSIILFYGSFQLGEMFHFSGVISVITAGLVLGTYGRKIGMSDMTNKMIDIFWEVIAFISNALIFLMIGLEISRIEFLHKGWIILGSIVIVLIARFLSVYISLAFDKSTPLVWKHIIAWGGLKGALSIALTLSVSPAFEGRELLLAMTFSNVVFSLLTQGTTIQKLVEYLGVK